jgi:TRAP-type C4-dicarboxylate transport system permease small subunit
VAEADQLVRLAAVAVAGRLDRRSDYSGVASELIPSYIWTEEMARFLFIWSIMLGAMIGVREGSHFEVDLWPNVSPRLDAAIKLIARVGVLVIALVFIWGGLEFTRFAWHRLSELAELPLWLIHVAWPAAGITWVIFLGEQMLDELRVLARGRCRCSKFHRAAERVW